MHQRVAMECRVHAQYVPHELVVRLVVDDVVVGDDKCVRCERSNHRNFGEADEDHGADHLRNYTEIHSVFILKTAGGHDKGWISLSRCQPNRVQANLVVRIESERLKLPAPFSRQIAEPLIGERIETSLLSPGFHLGASCFLPAAAWV
jgi:hypothetical protein